MQCNIDQRGRAARFIFGMVMLGIAVIVAGFILSGVLVGWWWWLIAGCIAASGLFCLYEARKGWCMMRAMGFRTPM